MLIKGGLSLLDRTINDAGGEGCQMGATISLSRNLSTLEWTRREDGPSDMDLEAQLRFVTW